VIVDMHAEATSREDRDGLYLDGHVTAVVGTHTHVATADERILPKGTAYITDLGMTGPYESILGRDVQRVLSVMTTAIPTEFDVAQNDVKLCGGDDHGRQRHRQGRDDRADVPAVRGVTAGGGAAIGRRQQ